jgi:hypothetical protein
MLSAGHRAGACAPMPGPLSNRHMTDIPATAASSHTAVNAAHRQRRTFLDHVPVRTGESVLDVKTRRDGAMYRPSHGCSRVSGRNDYFPASYGLILTWIRDAVGLVDECSFETLRTFFVRRPQKTNVWSPPDLWRRQTGMSVTYGPQLMVSFLPCLRT